MDKELRGKTLYAFGDSIIYGHTAPQQSALRLITDRYGLKLSMFARNGATVLPSDNQIIHQLEMTPAQNPDFIVFDGYTLGEAGTYMSFLSGNIMGIRVPACAASMDAVDVRPGTHKGEVVSAIAIAGSVISTVVFGLIAIFIGQRLLDSLPAPILVGLNYILPASYGAIITGYVKKNPPVGIFGLILGLLLNSSSFIPNFAKQILSVILCITFGVLLFKHRGKSNSK